MAKDLSKGAGAPKPPPTLKVVLREGYAAPAAPTNLQRIDVKLLNIRSAVPEKRQ